MKVISILSQELITIGAEVHDSEEKVDESYWWRHQMAFEKSMSKLEKTYFLGNRENHRHFSAPDALLI